MKHTMHRLLLTCFVLLLCQLSRSQPLTPELSTAHRGGAQLNIVSPSVKLTINKQQYVQCFQAIYNPATELSTDFKYKDIFQDATGNIIIKPGGNILWLGLGDPKRQKTLVDRYKEQNLEKVQRGLENKNDPMIRAFLLKLDTAVELMQSIFMTTERFAKSHNLDMNVDQNNAANQFGLSTVSTEKILQDALPHSLVTYVSDSNKEYSEKNGKIRDIETMQSEYNSRDFISKWTERNEDTYSMFNGEKEYLKSLAQDLDTILMSEGPMLDNLLNEANNKYVIAGSYSLTSENIENVKHLANDVHMRKAYFDKESFTQHQTHRTWLNERITFLSFYDAFATYLSAEFGARGLSIMKEVNLIGKDALESLKLGIRKPFKYLEPANFVSFVVAFHEKMREISSLSSLASDSLLYGMKMFTEKWKEFSKYTHISIDLSAPGVSSDVMRIQLTDSDRTLDGRTLDVKELNGRLYATDTREMILLKVSSRTEIEVINCKEPEHFKKVSLLINSNTLLDKTSHGIGSITFSESSSKDARHVVAFSQSLNTYPEKIVFGSGMKLDVVANIMYESGYQLGTPVLTGERGIMIGGKYKARIETAGLTKLSIGLANQLLARTDEPNIGYFPELQRSPAAYYNEQKKQNNYDYEIICCCKSDITVKKAADYMYARFEREHKTVLFLDYNGDHAKIMPFNEVRKNGGTVQFTERTRITLIGHGAIAGDELTISETSGKTLIGALLNHLLPDKQADVKLGKISVVACNTDSAEGAVSPRIVTFGRDVVSVLQTKNMQSTVVSVRNGKLQVDEYGHKRYPKIVGSETEWRYMDKLPVFVKYNENGVIYGVLRDGNVEWTPDKPSHHTIEKATKTIIVSDAFGDVDIAEDFSLKIRYMTNKLSGELAVSQSNVEIPRRGLISQMRETSGTYLDVFCETADNAKRLPSQRDPNGLQASLVQLEVKQWAETLSQTMQNAVNSGKLSDPEKWIPLIDTAEKDSSGQTRVTLMNKETTELRIVPMEYDGFYKFKKRTAHGGSGISLKDLPSISRGQIGMTGFSSMMGASFLIKGVIEVAKDPGFNKSGTTLEQALKIYAYCSIATGGFDAIADGTQIVATVLSWRASKKAVDGIVTMTSKLHTFLEVSANLGKVSMAIGGVGSIVSLGFSAAQLHRAQTHDEKVIAGVSVAFDSLNVATTGVAIGSMIATAVSGSATIAAISSAAGPVGIAVAVVGFMATTITQLSLEFVHTRSSAQEVGRYFYHLNTVYSKHGFEFDAVTQTFTVLTSAIVEEIDFIKGTITLDSQYIYRTKHGGTGSGRQNYFFLIRDFPVMIQDTDQAINVRQGLGFCGKFYFGHLNVTRLILPVVPKSFISYQYSRLPFCTAMHDQGFDIIRRLEQDERFDYDFYVVPVENIVSSINEEYVKTEITIKVKDVQVIFIPNANRIMKELYAYEILTHGTSHTLVLTGSESVTLKSVANQTCQWNIDIRLMQGASIGTISFEKNRLRINGTSQVSYVSSRQRNIINVYDGNGSAIVDFSSQTYQPVSVEMSETISDDQFREYLEDVSRGTRTGEHYIIISEFKKKGTKIGRAFYDISSRRIIYSNYRNAEVSKDFKSSVDMLGILQNTAFFMSNENGRWIIWNTDLKNHSIINSFNLFCGNEHFDVKSLGVREGAVLVAQIVQNVTLIYMIRPTEVLLVSIDGTQESVYGLSELCSPSTKRFLPEVEHRGDGHRGQFPGNCIYAKTVPVLPLKETTSEGITKFFWIYMNETIHDNVERRGVFCESGPPPVAIGVIRPNMTSECDDLTLRDIETLSNGTEIFFFFCGINKTLWRQVDTSTACGVEIPGGINRLEDFGATKFIRSNNDGLYVISELGEVSLAAVTFKCIAQHVNWKVTIQNMSATTLKQSHIVILNMTNENGKTLTAWYDAINDKVVIVSPEFDAKDIVYVGPTPTANLLWLYDKMNGSLLLQEILSEDEISNMTIKSQDEVRWTSGPQPRGMVVVTGLERAELMNGEVVCTDLEGVISAVNHYNGKTLLGLKATWLNTHSLNLTENLDDMCASFDAEGLVVMGYNEVKNTSDGMKQHSWYHCGWHTQVSLLAEPSTDPVFLGKNEQLSTLYFFADDTLVKYLVSHQNRHQLRKRSADYHTGKRTQCRQASVSGRTFLIQAQPSTFLVDIPMLDGIESLSIGVTGDTSVHITSEVWLHYETILVTSIGSGGYQNSQLIVDAPYPCNYFLSVIGNDSVYFDPISENILFLEDFTPVSNSTADDDNKALLEIIMCDSDPVIFVTSRPRMAGLQSKRTRQFYTELIPIGIKIVITLFSLLFVTA